MRNYDDYVSASVLTEHFNTDKNCELSPIIMHMHHRGLNEARRLKRFSRFKVPDFSYEPDPKEMFHMKYFSLLKNGLEEAKDSDAVSSVLFEQKHKSKRYEIRPTILSKHLHIIGEPDIIFYSDDYMHILELKDRNHLTFYKTDKLQVEIYMTIKKNNFNSDLRSQKLCFEGKEIRGSLLYNNGSLVPVILENEHLIKSTASQTLSNIRKYKSIFDLPKPSKCNPLCSNIDYCTRNKVTPYENLITGPGGIKIESRFHSQKA